VFRSPSSSAVRDYLNGGDWRLVAELTEVESGKRSDRPKLAEALKQCRVHGATLIIAKLDRLARNVAFISNLMESGVEFHAVDFPQANRLTIHILAAVAEHEAKMISERTRAALAAAKKRGVKLGGQRRYVIGKDEAGNKIYGDSVVGPAMATRRARARRQELADAKAADLAPIIEGLQAAGKTSLRAIAAGLNEAGIPAVRGGEWSAVQVQRVMSRPLDGVGVAA
jgi:DNA invertase Pin-like site-specific DNA recombinase